MSKTRRVIVTGVTGFLGRHLLSSLIVDPDLDLHIVGRASGWVPHRGIYHQADLFIEKEIFRVIDEVEPTDLITMAWCAGASNFRTDPTNRKWVLVTQRMIERFQEQGGKHVTVAGSVEEYSFTDGCLLDEEDSPTLPSCLYGQSKNELRIWLDRYGESTGLGWAWGRIFWTFGDGEPVRKFVAYIIHQLMRDQTALLGSGMVQRDFLHASEVGEGLALLFRRRSQGIYNIASGQPVLLLDDA